MAKSIKLKNNTFIDSSSINHNILGRSNKTPTQLAYLLPLRKINLNKPSADYGWCKILTMTCTYNAVFEIESYSNASALNSRGHFKLIVAVGTNNNILNVIYATNGLSASDFDFRKLDDGSYEVWFHIPQYTGYETFITAKYSALPEITLSGEIGTPIGTKLPIQ